MTTPNPAPDLLPCPECKGNGMIICPDAERYCDACDGTGSVTRAAEPTAEQSSPPQPAESSPVVNKYRLLELGETVDEGDEVRTSTGQWIDAGTCLDSVIDHDSIGRFRRPTSGEYVSLTDILSEYIKTGYTGADIDLVIEALAEMEKGAPDQSAEISELRERNDWLEGQREIAIKEKNDVESAWREADAEIARLSEKIEAGKRDREYLRKIEELLDVPKELTALDVIAQLRDDLSASESKVASLRAGNDELRERVRALKGILSAINTKATNARSAHSVQHHTCDLRKAIDSICDLSNPSGKM